VFGGFAIMQLALIVTIVLHLLSGVFWAGTTFVLARTGANQADQLLLPQRGAAAITVLTGSLLWYLVHRGGFDTTERILAFGALCAIVAGVIQGVTGGPALRKLAKADESDAARMRRRVATGQRVAAGLMAVTVICMAASRYA
jgi:uncharacterized membrane protein